MGPFSTGDMSRSFNLSLANSTAQKRLDLHSKELVTGVQSDIAGALRGDTAYLAQMEARLATLKAHESTATELAGVADRMQITLEGVQLMASSASSAMLDVTTAPSHDLISFATAQANAYFSDLVSQLNTRASGQYLFSGTDSTTAPIPAVDMVLDMIRDSVAGAATTTDLLAALDDFFDAPPGGGGFMDIVYQGADTPISARIAPETNTSLPVTANAEGIRNVMKGMAIAVLAGEEPHAGNPTAQTALLDAAGVTLLHGSDQITALRGSIGASELMIDQARSRQAAEATTLAIARNDLISVDRYEAATAVAEAEARLEALYSLTARLSRLSLTAYLR